MIRVGNTIDAVVACIGVLRAGAAFVIAGRNQDPQTVRYLERGCGCRIRIDDESMPEAMAVKGQSGFEPLDEHAPAYIIYTSGSTRAPRGVMIERGAMDMVIFFYNPSMLDPKDPDIKNVLSACDQNTIPIATNIATAEMLILGLGRGDLDWRIGMKSSDIL